MKALLILAVLALVVVAGCGQTVPSEEKIAAETVKVDPAVAEATSSLISDYDDVEIGEMI